MFHKLKALYIKSHWEKKGEQELKEEDKDKEKQERKTDEEGKEKSIQPFFGAVAQLRQQNDHILYDFTTITIRNINKEVVKQELKKQQQNKKKIKYKNNNYKRTTINNLYTTHKKYKSNQSSCCNISNNRGGENGKRPTIIDICKFRHKMANTLSVMTNVLRNVVSKQRIRYKEKGFNLDLAYICDNIIAMGYPADNIERIYRNRLEDVYKFLEENHHDHYKIYNLCLERSYDVNKFHGRVAVYPFEDHNPPTIELIQRFCADVDTWLRADMHNVAAVHCKAGKGRTGTMICCYLLYSNQQQTADDALAYYDEKRTKDRKGVTIPSQRRYVQYFAKLLRSNLRYERRFLEFFEIRFTEAHLLYSQGTVHCVISALQDNCGCHRVQALQNLNIDFRKSFTLDMKNFALRVSGDIKVELSHKTSKKKILHFWFNTYFVCDAAVLEGEGENAKLVYTLNKCEIDDAHKDKEHKLFTEDFKVQLAFYNETADHRVRTAAAAAATTTTTGDSCNSSSSCDMQLINEQQATNPATVHYNAAASISPMQMTLYESVNMREHNIKPYANMNHFNETLERRTTSLINHSSPHKLQQQQQQQQNRRSEMLLSSTAGINNNSQQQQQQQQLQQTLNDFGNCSSSDKHKQQQQHRLLCCQQQRQQCQQKIKNKHKSSQEVANHNHNSNSSNSSINSQITSISSSASMASTGVVHHTVGGVNVDVKNVNDNNVHIGLMLDLEREENEDNDHIVNNDNDDDDDDDDEDEDEDEDFDEDDVERDDNEEDWESGESAVVKPLPSTSSTNTTTTTTTTTTTITTPICNTKQLVTTTNIISNTNTTSTTTITTTTTTTTTTTIYPSSASCNPQKKHCYLHQMQKSSGLYNNNNNNNNKFGDIVHNHNGNHKHNKHDDENVINNDNDDDDDVGNIDDDNVNNVDDINIDIDNNEQYEGINNYYLNSDTILLQQQQEQEQQHQQQQQQYDQHKYNNNVNNCNHQIEAKTIITTAAIPTTATPTTTLNKITHSNKQLMSNLVTRYKFMHLLTAKPTNKKMAPKHSYFKRKSFKKKMSITTTTTTTATKTGVEKSSSSKTRDCYMLAKKNTNGNDIDDIVEIDNEFLVVKEKVDVEEEEDEEEEKLHKRNRTISNGSTNGCGGGVGNNLAKASKLKLKMSFSKTNSKLKWAKKFHWLQNYVRSGDAAVNLRKTLSHSYSNPHMNCNSTNNLNNFNINGEIATTTANIATKNNLIDNKYLSAENSSTEDYYSSICDNQLSFNNSPCKSPRSMVENFKHNHNIVDIDCVDHAAPRSSYLIANVKHNVMAEQAANILVVAARPAKIHAIGFNVNQININNETAIATTITTTATTTTITHGSGSNSSSGYATASTLNNSDTNLFSTPPTSILEQQQENAKISPFVFPNISEQITDLANILKSTNIDTNKNANTTTTTITNLKNDAESNDRPTT